MSDTSPLEKSNEHMLQSALETAFQSKNITPKSTASALAASTSLSDAPSIALEVSEGSEMVEEDAWKGEYEAQVEEWRAQSAEARAKAERERVRWEQIRKREAEERQALGQEPENWDALGSHITSSFAAASEALASSSASVASTSLGDSGHLVSEPKGSSSHLHDSQHLKTDTGSPSQKWEHIDSSPTSSYPSMLFPDNSIPSSFKLQQMTGCGQPQEQDSAEHKYSNMPPSTIPSLFDGTIAPRTRMNLLLSCLAINLLLPFVNGMMLGFGEIFAKNVLVRWMGWKSQNGRTAANVGIRI